MNSGKIIHFLTPFLFCPTIVGQKQKVLTPKKPPKRLNIANLGNDWEL